MYKQLLLAISLITASSVTADIEYARPATGSATLQAARWIGGALLKASDAVVNATVAAGRAIGSKVNALEAATNALFDRIDENPDVFIAGVAYIPTVAVLSLVPPLAIQAYLQRQKRLAREAAYKKQQQHSQAVVYDCYPRY